MKKSIVLLFLMCIAAPSGVMAHPGHGHTELEFSIIHYLVEPAHLTFMVVVTGCIIFSLFKLNTSKSKREH